MKGFRSRADLMCLIIFAHRITPQYPLVVAANRDEFHHRETAAATFWTDQPDLLAGRDLEQGGTWMGLTRSGRFAAVTNFRDPSRTAPAPRSRGELTLNYLSGHLQPQAYLELIADTANQYAGFNLLLGDGDSLWYFSNSRTGADPQGRELPPGLYGLSNARLDTPWPKVEKGKSVMAQAMRGALNHRALAKAVSDRVIASPEELSAQGLEGEMEQLLSAQFIVNERYGTRASTTLWIDNEGTAAWREESFAGAGVKSGSAQFSFALEKPLTPPGCE